RYFVASEEVATELAGLGVPPERIEVTGIPVDPRFARTLGREAARERLRLDPARRAVLVMGGGSGVGRRGELGTRRASHARDPGGEVGDVVGRLLADPEARERVREAAGRIAAPHAAENIARRVLGDLRAAEKLSA